MGIELRVKTSQLKPTVMAFKSQATLYVNDAYIVTGKQIGRAHV